MKLMDYIKTQKNTPNYMQAHAERDLMNKQVTASSLSIGGKMHMMTPTRTMSGIKRKQIANSALKSSYGRDGETRLGSPDKTGGFGTNPNLFAKRSYSQMQNNNKRSNQNRAAQYFNTP